MAASLGPDLASRATSSNSEVVDVDVTSVDGGVASSAEVGDLRLIHCGSILAKFDALRSAQLWILLDDLPSRLIWAGNVGWT